MVPVSVERHWNGRQGALVWWIDIGWDESERKAQRLRPPDVAAWSQQLYQMVVFAELIYDTDRNDGNILYTKDWRLWMIDFTRAFRMWHELPHPEALVAYDAGLAEKMNLLDDQGLTAALLRESKLALNDPKGRIRHRPIANDSGRPSSVIRLSTLHASTDSTACPAAVRARRPSPRIDLYRKMAFSTRACRWEPAFFFHWCRPIFATCRSRDRAPWIVVCVGITWPS